MKEFIDCVVRETFNPALALFRATPSEWDCVGGPIIFIMCIHEQGTNYYIFMFFSLFLASLLPPHRPHPLPQRAKFPRLEAIRPASSPASRFRRRRSSNG